jgi:hypothetical protein
MSYGTLTIPGVVTVAPDSIEIEEMAGQHDLATVTITGYQSLKENLGAPVIIEIIDGGYSKRLVGYLDTYARGSDLVNNRDVYFVLGASSVMRSGASRVWRDAKPVDIAKDIVKGYQFGLEFDSYPYTLPIFTQSSESDWETLRKLAGECGFFLFAFNTTIRMVHPIFELRRQMRNILPAYVAPKAGGVATDVGEFVTVDTKSPIGFENTVFHGVDKFGKTFSVTADTGADVTRKSQVLSQSLGEAQAAAARLKIRSYLQTRASMSVTGGAYLTAGNCIKVTNNDIEMAWLVTEMQHHWVTQSGMSSYTSSMSLTRSDRADMVPSAYRDVSNRPGNLLANKKWRAERNWVVEL